MRKHDPRACLLFLTTSNPPHDTLQYYYHIVNTIPSNTVKNSNNGLVHLLPNSLSVSEVLFKRYACKSIFVLKELKHICNNLVLLCVQRVERRKCRRCGLVGHIAKDCRGKLFIHSISTYLSHPYSSLFSSISHSTYTIYRVSLSTQELLI